MILTRKRADHIPKDSSMFEFLKGALCIRKRVENMGWLRVVDSLKIQVSFAKEPYKRDLYSPKRPLILSSLLIEPHIRKRGLHIKRSGRGIRRGRAVWWGGGGEKCWMVLGGGGELKSHSSIHMNNAHTNKLWKPRTQIYMELRYIDPQARVLNYSFK